MFRGMFTYMLSYSLRVLKPDAGGEAQWIGRRSLACELSLTFAWLTCDHFVGKVSTMGQLTRPTQPSIPAGSVNE